MQFVKMHGCGNDYVFIDGWREPISGLHDIPSLARRLSHRHFGVGSDGLIIVAPPLDPSVADARMLMWNADGSEAEMCGNGIRCAAKLVWDRRHAPSATPIIVHQRQEEGEEKGQAVLRISTGAGVLAARLRLSPEGVCEGATVCMGRPRLVPREVPVISGNLVLTVPLAVPSVPELRLRAVGMGNPHAVAIVGDIDQFPVAVVGPLIENNPLFPNRVNVEFTSAIPTPKGHIPIIRQRTWERGSGITQACGTGACATVVAWILDGLLPEREAIVRLDGGDLHIHWPTPDSEVFMEGDAVKVFEGTARL